jgi:xanthine/uracil permease
MFGMVAATGARILTGVDFKTNRYNLFVVAISVGFGLIPLVAPNFFRYTPDVLHPLLESGILLTAIVSVALNLFFNGLAKTEAAYEQASAAAAASEHAKGSGPPSCRSSDLRGADRAYACPRS